MSLLSEADKLVIRAAIRSVTDTFMVTPIQYFMGVDSLDRWNEDRKDKLFKKITIDALKEYDTADDVAKTLQGSEDNSKVTLTFNLEYLDEKGLIMTTSDNQKKAIFKTYGDYFKLNDDVYEVNKVTYDGPLDAKSVLVIVQGTMYKDTVMLENYTDF